MEKTVRYQVKLVYRIRTNENMTPQEEERQAYDDLSEIIEVLTDGGYVVAVIPGDVTIVEE